MSDPRPPLFDDGGALPNVDRNVRRSTGSYDAASADPRLDEGRPDERHPNYLIRRIVAIGLVVAVVATAAIIAGRLLGGTDGANSSAGGGSWDHVVTVEDVTGTVVVTNDSGEETTRFRFGIGPLIDSEVIGTNVVGLSDTTLALAPLDAGDTEASSAAIQTVGLDSTGVLIAPSGTVHTLIATNAAGDRVVLIHGPTGEVLDSATTSSIPGARYDLTQARSDPSGRNVLVTDVGNFQSVLFSFDREDVSFVSGLALAADDDALITAQNVGPNANVSFFDHAGVLAATAQTTSVRAGMVSSSGVILVGLDGEVLAMSPTDGAVAELATLTIGTIESGDVSTTGDRLIVTGTNGTAIINEAGDVVIEIPGGRPISSVLDPLASRGSGCLILDSSVDGEVLVTNLADGSVVAEAVADLNLLSDVTGCRPIVATQTGYTSLDDQGVHDVSTTGQVVGLSPDGGTVAVESAGRIELTVRMSAQNSDDPAEPIDVGLAGRTMYFADL